MTMQQVKEMIKDKHPYHPEVSKQRILHAGKQVENALLLSTVLGGHRKLLIDLETALNSATHKDDILTTHIFHLMIYQKASL